jgi:anthranilate phosphoribosyltransferase
MNPLPRSSWFAEALPALVDGREVPEAVMATAMRALTSGNVDETEAAAFLIGLRMKGETAGEISAAASVLREKMVRLDARGAAVLDTCGTGGDGCGTFNISTAVALVVAASGCSVVKHGNRSVSSRSGSADVLAELGVPVEKGPEWAQKCLDRFGFAFCFAPHFHPALADIGPLRRKLGVRTIFNLLGPLLNPAFAAHQLLGVGQLRLLDALAGAAAKLGTRRAILVCGADGLDEVGLWGPTHVRSVARGVVSEAQWRHVDFGLEACALDELKADGPAQSAAVIRSVLDKRPGPPRDIVLANAAAALLAAERTTTLAQGAAVAATAIDSGAAQRLLEQLRLS